MPVQKLLHRQFYTDIGKLLPLQFVPGTSDTSPSVFALIPLSDPHTFVYVYRF